MILHLSLQRKIWKNKRNKEIVLNFKRLKYGLIACTLNIIKIV